MANMDVTQRVQYERADLGDAGSTRLLTTRARRVTAACTLLAVVIAGALGYAAIWGIDAWHQLLVLGVIVVIFFGVAAWVYPNRKHV